MFTQELKQILAKISELQINEKRLLIAIAGPPAAGKSTLADLLVRKLNSHSPHNASLVPMDGYHLDNTVLDAIGLRAYKGAPATFDVRGFLALVKKISEEKQDISYPTFDRSLDRAIPNNASVSAVTKIVVFEGNYLLLNSDPWRELKSYFDLTVFVRPDLSVLEERLIRRWLGLGFSLRTATQKAMGNDIPNARNVLDNSLDADMEFSGV